MPKKTLSTVSLNHKKSNNSGDHHYSEYFWQIAILAGIVLGFSLVIWSVNLKDFNRQQASAGDQTPAIFEKHAGDVPAVQACGNDPLITSGSCAVENK